MRDGRLLKEYAETKSQAAFRQLVDRHMRLVYWTCRRTLSDAQLAEDATQAVFLLLAQKAAFLHSNASVSGWLFHAARLISRNAARGETRRRKTEEEAAQTMQHHSMQHHSAPEPELCEIEPWIDDALASLSPCDREVILLRYFEDLSFAEIADQLGAAENTTVKRAGRAIAKMRRYLHKREVTLSTAALGVVLAEYRAEAFPQNCYTHTMRAIHNVALGQPAMLTATSHLLLLHKGVHFTMQVAKYKYLIAGVALLFAGGIVGRVVITHRAKLATFVVADPTAISLPPNDPTASARTEIEKDMRAEGEDEYRRDAKQAPEPWDVPNTATFATVGGQALATDRFKSYGDSVMVGRLRASGMADVVVADRITSFHLRNNHVTLVYHNTVAGTATALSGQNDPTMPVGTRMQVEQDVQDEWQSINGRWMHVGPERDQPATVTASKDGHGVVMDASGPTKRVIRQF